MSITNITNETSNSFTMNGTHEVSIKSVRKHISGEPTKRVTFRSDTHVLAIIDNGKEIESIKAYIVDGLHDLQAYGEHWNIKEGRMFTYREDGTVHTDSEKSESIRDDQHLFELLMTHGGSSLKNIVHSLVDEIESTFGTYDYLPSLEINAFDSVLLAEDLLSNL